jgi:hypothetical protein
VSPVNWRQDLNFDVVEEFDAVKAAHSDISRLRQQEVADGDTGPA